MLSWVQYAYGCVTADVNTGGYFTIGPLTGPAVITEVTVEISLNQFSNFEWALSVQSSGDATQEAFESGVKLQREMVASSVPNVARVHFYAGDGGNPYLCTWPCWVPIENRPAWVSFWSDRIGGAANMRAVIAVRAERLWPHSVEEELPEAGAVGGVRSALEDLRARARRN